MPAPLKTDAEKADAIARDAADLAIELRRTGGAYGYRTNHRLLELCNAVISLIEDGDCMACREILMEELRCDKGGDPDDNLVPIEKCGFAGLPTVWS